MKFPRWIPKDAVLAIHSALVAEHGGLDGLRDEGLLESALARPRNRASYRESDLADLAAALGHGLARNHPFVDGNKRVALSVIDVFLQLNGLELVASEEDAVVTMRMLAEGRLPESDLAVWIRRGSRPLRDEPPQAG